MRKHSRTKQCIEPMTSCTSKNISLSNFSSSESSQIDDYIVPQNIFLKDSNMFSGSEEMVSNCLYSDITNNLKLKNQDNIINEKVKHFLKYTQPLNSSQKLDNIDNYNLLNYSDMQHKSCLLSSPDENVNNKYRIIVQYLYIKIIRVQIKIKTFSHIRICNIMFLYYE